MHQLFSALVTLLLSFCHHSAAARPLEATNLYESARPTSTLSFPDRHESGRPTNDSGYSSTECLSCGTMTVSFTVR